MKTKLGCLDKTNIFCLIFFSFIVFNFGCGGGCGDVGKIGKADARNEISKDAGATEMPEQVISAEQAARKHLTASNGQKVRVVGLQHKNGSTVAQNSLGETVEADATDIQRGTCNVVIQAKVKAFVADAGGIDGLQFIGNLPDVGEALFESIKRKSIPVLIPGSCVSDICFWTVLLRGDDCIRIAESDHYVGSTMKEFMAMSMEFKKRFLKTYGMCTTDEGENRCVVPIDDKRAIQGEAIFFGGTSWAGRKNLDFYKFKNGELNSIITK